MIRIPNKYSHLDTSTQMEMCSESLVEIFLREKGMDVIHEPSLSREITEGDREIADELYESLKMISDLLMSKYGTVNIPDLLMPATKTFIEVSFGNIDEAKEGPFAILMNKGFRIIVAEPEIMFEAAEAVLKSIEWKEYGSMKPVVVEDFA